MKKTRMYLSPESDVHRLVTEVICTSTLTLAGEEVDPLDVGDETDLGDNW